MGVAADKIHNLPHPIPQDERLGEPNQHMEMIRHDHKRADSYRPILNAESEGGDDHTCNLSVDSGSTMLQTLGNPKDTSGSISSVFSQTVSMIDSRVAHKEHNARARKSAKLPGAEKVHGSPRDSLVRQPIWLLQSVEHF